MGQADNQNTNVYCADFYSGQKDGARRSAQVIVPIVMRLVEPSSVVDVGCGVGCWLKVFQEHGVEDVVGIDGAPIAGEMLEIPRERFIPHDLGEPITVGRRFDLVVCLEVAEHLSPSSSDRIVELLTSLGPVVLFSAAIPYQGGKNHVNEQWPVYWAQKFGDKGYALVNTIRELIWDDVRVEYWYAQNIALYVDTGTAELHEIEEDHVRARRLPLDVVHPRMYEVMVQRWKHASEPSNLLLGELIRAFPGILSRSLRMRLTRLFRARRGEER